MADGKFEKYSKLYPDIQLERHSGLLEVTFGVGGTLVWTPNTRSQVASLFKDISTDSHNKVVMITGFGDKFWEDVEKEEGSVKPASDWRTEGLLELLLRIPVPVIAAINGPVRQYCELPLVSDIVLATEGVSFQESQSGYFQSISDREARRLALHNLFGLNKARYFLLTEESLTVKEAKQFGVVSEILEGRDLLNRAREMAFSLLRKPSEELVLIRRGFLKELQVQIETSFNLMRIWAVGKDERFTQPTVESHVPENNWREEASEKHLLNVLEDESFIRSNDQELVEGDTGAKTEFTGSGLADWNFENEDNSFESFSLHGSDISELADLENELNHEDSQKKLNDLTNLSDDGGELGKDEGFSKRTLPSKFDTAKTDSVSDIIKSVSTDGGENDVKLNLARAYIELGYQPSASLILEEILKDGTPEQILEAQRLKENARNG